jgi:hypothetical protein
MANPRSILSASDQVETHALTDLYFFDKSDPKYAFVKIPLMHVGANAKGLYWTEDMLRKIVPMFKDTPFKYDIDGKEGSSHVPDKLYSPHFDVGWTSDAYYDTKEKALVVEGWVTHPDVVEKLNRMAPNGKRELNYASMGVLISPEDVDCSICHKKMTECSHKRNEKYGSQTAYAVPTQVEKALHVALTNAPADTEAIIAEAVFQEMRTLRGENMAEGPAGVGAKDSYSNAQGRPNTLGNIQPQPQKVEPLDKYQKNQAGETMNTANPTDNMAKTAEGVGAMADEMGSPMGGAMGAEGPAAGGDMEITEILKSIIQRLIALEEKVTGMGAGAAPAPAAPSPEAKPPEMADVYGKYHKKLLAEVADGAVRVGKYKDRSAAIAHFADRSVDQLEVIADTLGGIEVASAPAPAKAKMETANVPEFGVAPQNSKVHLADMSASERKNTLGEFASWDFCFRPNKYQQ